MPKKTTKSKNIQNLSDIKIQFDHAPRVVYDSTASRSSSSPSGLDTFQTELSSIRAFKNPFCYEGGMVGSRDIVGLCVKAYWAFPLLRNVVEIMVELCNRQLHLKGGNEKTRAFIKAWWKRIGVWDLTAQFFREYFRSANPILYRFDGKFTSADLKKITQVYGAVGDIQIPVKYVFINPECVAAQGALFMNAPVYFKILTPLEIESIKNPKTEEDKIFVAGLDPAIREGIARNTVKAIQLDPKNLRIVPYKAQSYEPMGVPFSSGVLEDINSKMELKQIDLSMARTTNRALLHFKVGESPTDQNKGNNFNPAVVSAIESFFGDSAIARTLVTDWMVDGEWLIPDLGKILGPEKYKQLDTDIAIGLNAVFFNNDERFANASIKVQIFVERLKEAQNAYINKFLQPEVEMVCKAIGAKNYPTVFFEEMALRDELQYDKLAVQMAQMGLLTPEELFEVLESGKMPDFDASLASQTKFRELKEKDLYLPLIGGSSELQRRQIETEEEVAKISALSTTTTVSTPTKKTTIKAPPKQKGRPTGPSGPRNERGRSPMSRTNAALDMDKVLNLIPKVSRLQDSVEKELKRTHKIKTLNDLQIEAAKSIVESIISQETEEKWGKSIKSYIKNLIANKLGDVPADIIAEIQDIQIRYELDSYKAAILRLARTEAPEETEE